jgi:hypothetical protein
VEWKQKFSLVTLHAGSDHTPLFIDSGEAVHMGNKNTFSFELSWIRQDDFYEMVLHE